MTDTPVFPKPKDIKTPAPAVRVYSGGRECCNLLTKDGRAEYQARKRKMWERQGHICCLYVHLPECPGKLNWADTTFDHEATRGLAGGKRDDRIEINGKWVNGAAHYHCNMLKSSRRIYYNDTLQIQPDFHRQLLPLHKTTPSGKALFRCTKCGYETPSPTKTHQCGE